MSKTAWGTPARQPVSFASAMLDDIEEQKLRKQQLEDYQIAVKMQDPEEEDFEELPNELEFDPDLALAQQLQAQFDQEKFGNASGPSSSSTSKELGIDQDQLLALRLQAQFDSDFNRSIAAREKNTNANSKVQISYEKYRLTEYPAMMDEGEEVPDEIEETLELPKRGPNQQSQASSGRRGKKNKATGPTLTNGRRMITTKHDIQNNSIDNARRMESMTGLPVGNISQLKDLRVPYKVFNSLKNAAGKSGKNRNKTRLFDEEDFATQESVLDKRTKLILLQMINQGILDHVEGIVSTGKEANVYYAQAFDHWEDEEEEEEEEAPKKKKSPKAKKLGDEDEELEFDEESMEPVECVIKIFKSTLQEFKNREEYIREDKRYTNRLARHNSRKLVKMWAEKETLNLERMRKVGVPCPEVLYFDQHVLVLSLIGQNKKAAPKIRDVAKFLSSSTRDDLYDQCRRGMRDMYQKARLVHADLSEYNLLYHEHKLWFIDVSQAIERSHPNANLFLFRDCCNVTRFFQSAGVSVMSELELFSYVTCSSLSVDDQDLLQEQIRTFVTSRLGGETQVSLRDPSIHNVLNLLVPTESELFHHFELHLENTEDEDEDEDEEDEEDEEGEKASVPAIF